MDTLGSETSGNLSSESFFIFTLYLVAFIGLGSAPILTTMEKLLAIHFQDLNLPPVDIDWLSTERKYGILALLTLFTLGLFGFTRKQKYAPAPIICVSEAGDLTAARQRFVSDAQSMLQEGYTQNKGKPFYVPSPLGERLMIPAKYVEELKTAPKEEVDFMGGFFEMFEHNFTGIGSRSTLHPRTAKQQLNQHMDEVLGPIEEEIRLTFEEKIPLSDNYTDVPMAEIILESVARASNRINAGKALSKNKEWVKTTIEYADAGFVAALKIKKYPYYIRYLVAPFVPEIQQIKRHHELARKVIVPIINQREAELSKPADFLQWMINGAKGSERDKNFIAEIQLKITLAALHTSAAPPMQLVYDLCHRPGIIQPLREEIENVMKEYGSLNKQALMKMYKLDSFMKESQRHNPLLLCTRKLLYSATAC